MGLDPGWHVFMILSSFGIFSFAVCVTRTAANLCVWLLACVCRASWRQKSPHREPHPSPPSPGPATTPSGADWPPRWAPSWSGWTDCCCGLEAIANTSRIQSLCPARTISQVCFSEDWSRILKCWWISAVCLCYTCSFYSSCLVVKRSCLQP